MPYCVKESPRPTRWNFLSADQQPGTDVHSESSRKDTKSITELYEGVGHDIAKQSKAVTKIIRDTHALQVRMENLQQAIDQLGMQQCPSSTLCDQLSRRLDEVVEEQRAFRDLVQLQRGSPSCNGGERRLATLGDEAGPFSTPTRLPSGFCFLTPGLVALANNYDPGPSFTTAGSGTRQPLDREIDVFNPVETPRAVQRSLARDFSTSMQIHSLTLSPPTDPAQLWHIDQDAEDNLAEDPFEYNLSTTPNQSEIADSSLGLHAQICVPSFEVHPTEPHTDEAEFPVIQSGKAHSGSPLLIRLDENFDLQFKPLPPLPDDKPDLLDPFDFDDANKIVIPPFFSERPSIYRLKQF